MAKDNKKEKLPHEAKFGGSDSYDYLKRQFDNQYVDFSSGNIKPSSRNAYTDQQDLNRRNEAFQRYMLTGQVKNSGSYDSHSSNLRIEALNQNRKKSNADRFFEAGIPASQWAYYANKAGISNVNSKKDAKALIAAYNADERFTADQAGEIMDGKLSDYEKNQAANSDNQELKEIVLSEHMQKAKDIVDKWESGNPPHPIFSSESSFIPTNKRTNAPVPVDPQGFMNQATGRKKHQLHRDIDIANLTDPDQFLENRKQQVVNDYNINPALGIA